jgi:hypothetical protein
MLPLDRPLTTQSTTRDFSNYQKVKYVFQKRGNVSQNNPDRKSKICSHVSVGIALFVS